MMTAASSAMTMIATRVATKSISTSRTVWLKRAAIEHFADAEERRGDEERARAPCVELRRQART